MALLATGVAGVAAAASVTPAPRPAWWPIPPPVAHRRRCTVCAKRPSGRKSPRSTDICGSFLCRNSTTSAPMRFIATTARGPSPRTAPRHEPGLTLPRRALTSRVRASISARVSGTTCKVRYWASAWQCRGDRGMHRFANSWASPAPPRLTTARRGRHDLRAVLSDFVRHCNGEKDARGRLSTLTERQRRPFR